jgi:cytidine deaminase
MGKVEALEYLVLDRDSSRLTAEEKQDIEAAEKARRKAVCCSNTSAGVIIRADNGNIAEGADVQTPSREDNTATEIAVANFHSSSEGIGMRHICVAGGTPDNTSAGIYSLRGSDRQRLFELVRQGGNPQVILAGSGEERVIKVALRHLLPFAFYRAFLDPNGAVDHHIDSIQRTQDDPDLRQIIFSAESKDFASLDPVHQTRLRATLALRQRSYCPDSCYAVASLIAPPGLNDKAGEGWNTEDVTFKSVCAEQVAIGNFVLAGHEAVGVDAMYVAGAPRGQQSFEPCTPCGFCRGRLLQRLKEGQNPLIYMIGSEEAITLVTRFRNLMPLPFPFVDPKMLERVV